MGSQLLTRVHPETPVNKAQMTLYRSLGDAELCGNFSISHAGAKILNDAALYTGELI